MAQRRLHPNFSSESPDLSVVCAFIKPFSGDDLSIVALCAKDAGLPTPPDFLEEFVRSHDARALLVASPGYALTFAASFIRPDSIL